MFVARPTDRSGRRFALEDPDGAPLGELALADGRQGGQLVAGDATYVFGRAALESGPWQMREGDAVVYETTKPAMVRNRLMTEVQRAQLELGPKEKAKRTLVLTGPDWRDLGTIRRPSMLSKRIEVDLVDAVPEKARWFFLFQALVLWAGFESEVR